MGHVAATYGRDRLKTMLKATTEAELLGMLGLSETELLERWRRSVASSPTH